jgi:hypothetical protein
MADDKVLPRACLALKEDRLSVYMNLAGIAFLRDRLERLVQSDPAGHFEIHLSDELEGDRFFDRNLAARAWTLVAPSLVPHVARRRTGILDGEEIEYLPFDLNIMVISESELDELATLEESGILPDMVEEESS